MAANEFSGGMNHDIRAVLNRPDHIRCSERIVNHKRNLMRMGNCGDGVNIRDIRIRIAQGLDKHGFCLFIDRAFDLVRILRVHESRTDSVSRKGVVQEVIAASVYGLLRYDIVPRPCQGKDGISDRRRACRNGQGSDAAFQSRYSLLKNALGGIGQPAVDIAGIPQIKTVRRMLRAVEDIGCRLIDRHRPGIRNRIRLFLTDVKLQRFEFVLVITHDILPSIPSGSLRRLFRPCFFIVCFPQQNCFRDSLRHPAARLPDAGSHQKREAPLCPPADCS